MTKPGIFVARIFGTILFLAVFLPFTNAARSPALGEQAGQAAPNLSPRDWNRTLMARGQASESLGQKEDALADYTLAIESHALAGEEQAHALFDRGLLLDGMNRLDDALGDYSAALSLSPKFAAALNNRANVYRRLGRLPEARRDYQASLAAGNPQSQYPYYGLGQIAEAEGNGTDAEELYARALASDPHYALARERLTALASGEEIVHLHPPMEKQSPGPVAEQAVPTSSPPSTLGPALRSPARHFLAAPKAPAAASNEGASGPPLKPSLDEGGRGAQVQLGAWRSRTEAEEGWNRATARAGDLLTGISPHIVSADLPAGRYYRLRVPAGPTGSKSLCAALTAKGLDCIPAPN